jgi:DNA-binding transcriptional ArsR family regulator
MAAWTSADEPVLATATGVARELADPIRLTVLQLLASEGTYGMTQLAEALDLPSARLGNHLSRLRAAGLITVEHHGRHATYGIANPEIGRLLDALARYAGGTLPVPRPSQRAARMCYDHAAGPLGVGLFDELVARDALRRPNNDTDELELGPAATEVLADFGVDVTVLATRRRKVATQCLDRTLRVPHLGGALGAILLDSLVDAGYVRITAQRELVTTERGQLLFQSWK